MRKRNTPIRMITVRPAQPRRHLVLALAQRFGIGRRAADGPSASTGRERLLEVLDLDQRVREVGEW